MDAFEARHATRDALHDITTRLVAEFHHLPPGAVMGYVARAREDLLRAGVRDGLAPAAESMARARLARALAPHVV